LLPQGQASTAKIDLQQGDYRLQGGEMVARIDGNTGLLLDLSQAGQSISLAQGPVPVHDTLAVDTIYWEEHEADGTAQLHVRSVREPYGGYMDWTWTIHPAGLLGLDVNYLPAQAHYDLLGVSFQYPEEKVQGIRYLGQGPYRVYKNRLRGGQLAVWQKDYNDTRTGQEWVYPEFKGFHQDLYWAELATEEGTLQIFSETEDLFLHLFTPRPPSEAYNENTDGIYPTTGNLSFLNVISPIGTKFKRAAQLGPSGHKNMFFYSGSDPVLLRVKLWLGIAE
jgi:hypothetical protein